MFKNPIRFKTWLTQARDSIAAQIAVEDTPSFTINPQVNVTNNIGFVSGTAPVEVSAILANGIAVPITWNFVTSWTAAVTLQPGTNQLAILGVDDHNQPVPSASVFVTAIYNGTITTPSPYTISINEWMASNTKNIQDALDGNKYDDWFELYNFGTNTVDLAGCFLTDTLSVSNMNQIPFGYSIAPGSFLWSGRMEKHRRLVRENCMWISNSAKAAKRLDCSRRTERKLTR
jgi:hypothetical protein